jgi:oligosaccharyl transferase complex subunit OST4
MITDEQLYSLALFLGSAAMLLIILYHFLEVNKKNDDETKMNSSGKPVAITVKS